MPLGLVQTGNALLIANKPGPQARFPVSPHWSLCWEPLSSACVPQDSLPSSGVPVTISPVCIPAGVSPGAPPDLYAHRPDSGGEEAAQVGGGPRGAHTTMAAARGAQASWPRQCLSVMKGKGPGKRQGPSKLLPTQRAEPEGKAFPKRFQVGEQCPRSVSLIWGPGPIAPLSQNRGQPTGPGGGCWGPP